MPDAATIARALGGKKSGRQWSCRCPAHDDRNPSLIIYDGREKVQVRCLAGCDPIDVIEQLKARGLWNGGDSDVDPHQRLSVERETIERAREEAKNGALAGEIWREGLDPHGTLAEVYLLGRNLALPDDCSSLRYHPACPRGAGRQPALIALMQDLDSSKPVAIQRVFLTADARKDGRPQMLGPAAHAAMKLSGHGQTFDECLSYCSRLYVCEGLETGLGLIQHGLRPVWALGSAGAIGRLPVMFGVGSIVICADHDDVGLEGAIDCMQRWQRAPHHRAVIWSPNMDEADFADGAPWQ